MPPKKKQPKKATKSPLDEFLEKFDEEEFDEFSAVQTKVADSLTTQVFDRIADGMKDDDAEYVLGIDEAGRGPVSGPMVYSAAFCKLDQHQDVRTKLGANDSKQLKEIDRERMLKSIDKSNWVGYTGVILPPGYISSSMLRRIKYNLNQMSHDTAIAMIKRAIDHHKINVKEVYVDTVGKPEIYQDKLQKIFPRLLIKVESKADATYPIVGAASIVAKVTRDVLVHNWAHLEPTVEAEMETGSGYPGDPKTKKWLRAHVDKFFGLPTFCRLSWGTSKELMEKESFPVTWEDLEDAEEEENAEKVAKKRNYVGEPVVPQKSSRKCPLFRENHIHRVSLAASMLTEELTC